MNFNSPALTFSTAVIAVLISIAAVFFAWKQVDVSQTHNRLSVVPLLQITPYLEGKAGKNGLFLSNDGLGPAIIKGFSVRSGGVVAEGFSSDRWREVIATTSANPDCFGTGWPKGETVLKAGTEVPLVFGTRAAESDACLIDVVKLIGGKPIEISIEYQSVYGEKKHLVANSSMNSQSLESLYRKLVAR
jgi:hypothetical protein